MSSNRRSEAGRGTFVSRRGLLKLGAGAGAGSWIASHSLLAPEVRAAEPQAGSSDATQELYRAFGVRPFVNCRGTLTVLGGNIELPEVREAKSIANRMHAQLDELAAAAGRRLAELTGAEWGMVSSGCAAAMSHATAACVAGGNPDLHVRIPNLDGFARDEVLIPSHSRNVYDAAIRAVGVRIVEAGTPEELERAIGPRTAMIYIFANDRNEDGPMGTQAISAVAARHGVPVLVDAAAEILTVPNIHLQRGATLVAYSGGKFLRGPQSAGLLLGRKELVQAAWIHGAPHHGYARSMKVGREEIVGMVVAVEQWMKRDHDAEWKAWTAQVQHVADRVAAIPGVVAVVRSVPGSRTNRSPSVVVRWTSAAIGLTGQDVVRLLDAGEPRILINAGGGGGAGQTLPGDTGVSLVPSTMAAGDEQIVADRLYAVLSGRHTLAEMPAPRTPATDVSGQWAVTINYAASTSTHDVVLLQSGSRLTGSHRGNYVTRDVQGTIAGDSVSFGSTVTERTGDSLVYRFSGTVRDEAMSGTLDMGEYLTATWSAVRRGSARGA
jgi:L-seryl-tRNA(Ser) seleniumtransferase